jgi:hypothetical protein
MFLITLTTIVTTVVGATLCRVHHLQEGG